MKIRVTLLTENNRPKSVLGPNPEGKARKAWEIMCALLNEMGGANNDKVSLEGLEFIEEDTENDTV